jgi:hypothetical protein
MIARVNEHCQDLILFLKLQAPQQIFQHSREMYLRVYPIYRRQVDHKK